MEFNCTPDIGKMLIKVYASLLLMFGIPGNIISAIIMGGDKSNRLTTRLIIIILAIADNLVLLTAVLRYWLMEVYGWDLRTTGPLSCKIHVFAVGFSTDFAVGVLCAVAVERLLVVAIPYKASNLVTLRSVVIGMTCFALSVTIKNSLHFWMMGWT
uniref:SJCHGC03552 protein n=1 Tax=Schistosoma japonicum TaxID=6182 RepID=Q5DH78_SCHJA|nr:SJCHGC03552 protein [Schistosoma japonicum]